jgi:beta-glucosidase
VNLTDPTANRPAPYSTFTYYGSNVYAYLLQQYGNWIDLISIQFYESYSEASYKMKHDGNSASDYLVKYIDELVSSNESFYVNFTEDLEVGLSAQNVSLPLQKLVLGFGNGWASNSNRIAFISPSQVNITWQRLNETSPSRVPRGFMFWTIDTEGENGIFLAKALHAILNREDHTRYDSISIF